MFKLSPITHKRLRKFKKIKRAYISFWIVLAMLALSLFSEVIANNKPILLKVQNKWYFPVYKIYKGSLFGTGSDLEPEYKKLIPTLTQAKAILPPIYWGYNESNERVERYPSPPTRENLLGTDNRGRDVLTRLIYGFRVSMVFAFMNYFFAVTIGLLTGGLQGYLGGRVDILGQRAIEIWGALPRFFILILLGSIFQPGLLALTVMSAIFSWIEMSYYLRAEVLRVKQGEFVLAATALGASRMANLFTHVLPNSLTPVVTFTPFIITHGVLLLSYLDFLGFGVQPPTASLGELLRQGQQNFDTAWWLAVFPFALLAITIMLLNFIGEGVRTAFDPRKAI